MSKQVYGSKISNGILYRFRDNVSGDRNNYEPRFKCYCSDCQAVSELKESPNGRQFYDPYRSNKNKVDCDCPECGRTQLLLDVEDPQARVGRLNRINNSKKSRHSALNGMFAFEHDSDNEHINYNNAVIIPNIPVGRWVFSEENEDGSIKSVRDNVVLKDVAIFMHKDGSAETVYSASKEISEVTDLSNNNIYTSCSYVSGSKADGTLKKELASRYNSIDPFKITTNISDLKSNEPRDNARIGHVEDPNSLLAKNRNKNLTVAYSPDVFDEKARGTYDNIFVSRNPVVDIHVGDLSKSRMGVSNIKATMMHRDDVEKIKRDLIVRRFDDSETLSRLHPTIKDICLDFAHNGAYLAEHHIRSDETNTDISDKKLMYYNTMMVRYPAAFEYVCQRTQDVVVNNAYSYLKKHPESGYNDINDYINDESRRSSISKRFREELDYVNQQLCVVDDKILRTIGTSKSADDMINKLKFYAFGPQDSMTIGGKELSDKARKKIGDVVIPYYLSTDEPATKAFDAVDYVRKAYFGGNCYNPKKPGEVDIGDPIGVANTAYTLNKIVGSSRKDAQTLCNFIKLTHLPANTEVVKHDDEQKPITRNTAYNRGPSAKPNATRSIVADKPRYFNCDAMRAGTLRPIISKSELAFIKNYYNSHTDTDLLKLYGYDVNNPNEIDLKPILMYGDAVRNYDTIMSHNCRTVDNDAAYDEYFKFAFRFQLEGYLKSNSVRDAYIDFAEIFKGDTENVINNTIRQIKTNESTREAVRYCMNNGVDATLEEYPNLSDGRTEAEAKEFLKAQVNAISKNYLMPRNGEQLFKGRSIAEISSEVEHLSRKACKYERLEYTDEERERFEASYPSPTGKGHYTFSLMKDSVDFINVADVLKNCVGGESYISSAKNKTAYLLHMDDEDGRPVGCIELRPGRFNAPAQCIQFQGYRDRPMLEPYASVAKRWLDDKNIDYENCGDVRRFGQVVNNDIDYHTQEIDSVTGLVYSIGELRLRKQERIQFAKDFYGVDEHGEIKAPEVPADIKEYVEKFKKSTILPDGNEVAIPQQAIETDVDADYDF
ncbi:hypothetical protein J6A31_05845 [bacterium]|nr:hypothetical protein [bacterium]